MRHRHHFQHPYHSSYATNCAQFVRENQGSISRTGAGLLGPQSGTCVSSLPQKCVIYHLVPRVDTAAYSLDVTGLGTLDHQRHDWIGPRRLGEIEACNRGCGVDHRRWLRGLMFDSSLTAERLYCTVLYCEKRKQAAFPSRV